MEEYYEYMDQLRSYNFFLIRSHIEEYARMLPQKAEELERALFACEIDCTQVGISPRREVEIVLTDVDTA